MKKVRDTASVPRGGHWTYTDPDTGTVLVHPYYNTLLGRAKEYRRTNNLPIGLQFNEQFEQIICEKCPISCEEFEPPSLAQKASTVVTALLKAAKNWRHPVVSAEELERRRNICAECNYFGGGKSLVKLACQRCGCAGLKVALASEHCPLNPPKW